MDREYHPPRTGELHGEPQNPVVVDGVNVDDVGAATSPNGLREARTLDHRVPAGVSPGERTDLPIHPRNDHLRVRDRSQELEDVLLGAADQHPGVHTHESRHGGVDPLVAAGIEPDTSLL